MEISLCLNCTVAVNGLGFEVDKTCRESRNIGKKGWRFWIISSRSQAGASRGGSPSEPPEIPLHLCKSLGVPFWFCLPCGCCLFDLMFSNLPYWAVRVIPLHSTVKVQSPICEGSHTAVRRGHRKARQGIIQLHQRKQCTIELGRRCLATANSACR